MITKCQDPLKSATWHDNCPFQRRVAKSPEEAHYLSGHAQESLVFQMPPGASSLSWSIWLIIGHMLRDTTLLEGKKLTGWHGGAGWPLHSLTVIWIIWNWGISKIAETTLYKWILPCPLGNIFKTMSIFHLHRMSLTELISITFDRTGQYVLANLTDGLEIKRETHEEHLKHCTELTFQHGWLLIWVRQLVPKRCKYKSDLIWLRF